MQQEPAATAQQPAVTEPAAAQSVPQPAAQPVPETPPAEPTPPPAAPDPIAADGYAGFIPRNEPGDEPFAPAFAKSEAELREEFNRRFNDVIPAVSGGSKPQQTQPPKQPQTAGSRFADMVAQYGGQPSPTDTPDATAAPKSSGEDDYASDDDEIIEESGLAGRSVVEEVLNARLVEERNTDGTPKL